MNVCLRKVLTRQLERLREDLVKIPWDTIYLMSSVDEVWEAWKTLFFQAVERNIQKKLIKRRRDVPWLNSELKKLLHKKRRLWKKAKFSGDQAKWAKYKKFSNLVKDNLKKAYFAYVKDLAASLNTNPKRFWSFVKSCTKKQSTPGCIVYDGARALTPEDKANVFNQFFCSVFNKRIDNLSSIPRCDYSTVSLPVHLINDLICTPSEVAKVLKSLNVNKACGPDGVSPRLLKECHMELAPSLTRLFNYTASLVAHYLLAGRGPT